MVKITTSIAIAAVLLSWCAAEERHPQLGPGAKIPLFELPDQNGSVKTFGDIAGPNGAMLVFFRSADW